MLYTPVQCTQIQKQRHNKTSVGDPGRRRRRSRSRKTKFIKMAPRSWSQAFFEGAGAGKKILKMALGRREPGVRPFKREPEQETVKEIYKYRTQEPRYF